MSTDFSRRMWRGNAVFVLGLGLPSVLYASGSVPESLVFAVTVVVLVPLSHVISWHIENVVWPIARPYTPLVVASVLLTGMEALAGTIGFSFSSRGAWLYRALAVDALVLWPALTLRQMDRLRQRIISAASVAASYVPALILMTVARTALISLGVSLAETLAGALFLVAAGKLVLNAVRQRLPRPEDQPAGEEEG